MDRPLESLAFVVGGIVGRWAGGIVPVSAGVLGFIGPFRWWSSLGATAISLAELILTRLHLANEGVVPFNLQIIDILTSVFAAIIPWLLFSWIGRRFQSNNKTEASSNE